MAPVPISGTVWNAEDGSPNHEVIPVPVIVTTAVSVVLLLSLLVKFGCACCKRQKSHNDEDAAETGIPSYTAPPYTECDGDEPDEEADEKRAPGKGKRRVSKRTVPAPNESPPKSTPEKREIKKPVPKVVVVVDTKPELDDEAPVRRVKPERPVSASKKKLVSKKTDDPDTLLQKERDRQWRMLHQNQMAKQRMAKARRQEEEEPEQGKEVKPPKEDLAAKLKVPVAHKSDYREVEQRDVGTRKDERYEKKPKADQRPSPLSSVQQPQDRKESEMLQAASVEPSKKPTSTPRPAPKESLNELEFLLPPSLRAIKARQITTKPKDDGVSEKHGYDKLSRNDREKLAKYTSKRASASGPSEAQFSVKPQPSLGASFSAVQDSRTTERQPDQMMEETKDKRKSRQRPSENAKEARYRTRH